MRRQRDDIAPGSGVSIVRLQKEQHALAEEGDGLEDTLMRHAGPVHAEPHLLDAQALPVQLDLLDAVGGSPTMKRSWRSCSIGTRKVSPEGNTLS